RQGAAAHRGAHPHRPRPGAEPAARPRHVGRRDRAYGATVTMRPVPRAALALPLLLADCAPPITPRPEASTVAPPADWPTDLPASGAIERQWWDRFGDPQLAVLVDRARANNSDLAIAAARVAEARAQERVARSLLLP